MVLTRTIALFARSEEPDEEDESSYHPHQSQGAIGSITGIDAEPGKSTRKRPIGFVTDEDRVLKSGIVKSRRSPKRAKKE